MTHLALFTAHPSPTSFNAALAASYARGAEAAGASVAHLEVTALSFDPILRGGYAEPMPDEPDLARARHELERADHVAFFFPTWWAHLPAALKGLIDRLLVPGWAFRFEGKPLPTGLMRGKSARYVATMDSPALWYWLAHHDALGGSFGRGTLSYVGFGPVRRDLIFGVRKLAPAARERWIARMAERGREDAEAAALRLPRAEAVAHLER
jgi:putative NADPH-quinone reductase